MKKTKSIAFLFLAGLFCIFSINADAFSVDHTFSVLIGPFNASDTSFSYGLTDKDYFVKSNVKTCGVFDTLYPFSASYQTTGRINKDALETTSYKYQSQSRFTKRSKELVYDQKGKPIYALTSKNDKEKKKAVNQEIDCKDTTDLQTVFAELAKRYNTFKFCHGKMEVFDGKRRFDVIFKDEGKEELQKNQYCPFSGLAAKCSMYIDKLDSEDDDLLWQSTSAKPVYFWILEDQKTKLPFIAKIVVKDSPLGKVEVYTKEINIKE